MFMPLTTLFALDRDKAAQLAGVIAALFPVPEKFLDEAVREITGGAARPARLVSGWASPAEAGGAAGGNAESPRWDRLAADLVGTIRASATPERTDRLFPGDIDQFRVPGGGLGLAHGAAGVLYALSEAAGVRVPEYEEWLVTRAADPPQGTHLGLYDGLAGVAYTLARLGHLDAAVQAARSCLSENWGRLGHGLYGGLSGFALAMISVGDHVGEPGLAEAGIRAAETVAAPYAAAERGAVDQGAAAAAGTGGAVGLLRGASGKALLFIRLYERTGDPAYLDAAEAAIGDDLRRCVTDSKGALQVDDGWRTLPYLGGGSVGIGMVIDQFAVHRQHEEFADAARAIRLAAGAGLYAQAGLFNGRAGMIAYLAGTRDERGQEAGRRVVGAHVDRLAWHAVRYEGGVAFPGDMLLRLSMDLGTGAAGVLLGTAAALAPCGAALPFFAQPARLPVRVLGSSRAPVREAPNRPAPARR
jgi:lantibiotic modifying enzyme